MDYLANFVTIQRYEGKAYFDRWGAMDCVYVFAKGPRAATNGLGRMKVVDELMDWASARGGYLLDFDHRTAICFGRPFLNLEHSEQDYDDVIAVMPDVNESLKQGPRAFFQRFASQWRGWKLIWDYRGVDAFAEYLQARGVWRISFQPPALVSNISPPETFQA